MQRLQKFFTTKQGRVFSENLRAYGFLTPAAIILFIFNIFPVGFAFFVSLHRWRRFPGEYRGIDNYESAMGDFAYTAFFWIALALTVYALWRLWRYWQNSREEPIAWLFVPVGILNAIAMTAFVGWFFMLLPIVLEVPRRLLGQEVTREIFVSEFIRSFNHPDFPEVYPAGNLMLLLVGLAILASGFVLVRLQVSNKLNYFLWGTSIAAAVIAAGLIFQFVVSELNTLEDVGKQSTLLTQSILLTVGILLVIAAYWAWQRANQFTSNLRWYLSLSAALLLFVGGLFVLTQFPELTSNADDELWVGFRNTLFFSLTAVPIQLGIGMILAYLLFQKIRGRGILRLIYFMPYVMPFVATATVFRILFSNEVQSPANNFLGIIGIAPQNWLLEPRGVMQLLASEPINALQDINPTLGDWLAGPSLALLAIIIYSMWTYIGYSAVIFLAGLGNIPNELYEAAQIDGSSKWHEFRYITFPLLSPTTFFLSIIAVIGTFKAFTQIFIMRSPSAADAVNTASVVIFDVLRTETRYGFGSAMSFVLFAIILALTLFQNRYFGRRVFYG